MRKITMPLALAVLLLATAFVAIGVAWGQGSGPQIVNRETQGDSVREITSPPDDGNAPQQPNIGFIDSPSATCYQPDPTQNICYVSWYYLSVNASPNYMITMTAFLNDFGPVAHTQGFFQTSMYVPYNMLGQGIKVPAALPARAAIRNWAKPTPIPFGREIRLTWVRRTMGRCTARPSRPSARGMICNLNGVSLSWAESF